MVLIWFVGDVAVCSWVLLMWSVVHFHFSIDLITRNIVRSVFDHFCIVWIVFVFGALLVLSKKENVLWQSLNYGQHMHGEAQLPTSVRCFKFAGCMVEERIFGATFKRSASSGL